MIIERGILHAYDSTTHTAAVQLFGSMSRILLGVPVAHHIPADHIAEGTACAVAFFAEGSQALLLSTLTDPANPVIITQTQLDAHTVAEPFDAHPTNPACRAYRTTNQSTPNGTWTALALNAERFDTDDIHDNATNNTRLTCKTAGIYQISGTVRWYSNNTGTRGLYITINGTIVGFGNRPNASGADFMTVSAPPYQMTVGQYAELWAYQASGGNLDVQSSGNYSPEFGMVRVA